MRATDYPYCQSPFTVLAHRGGAGMAVNKGIENTLAAFGHAVEVGCTYLETDVHATSDGVLVPSTIRYSIASLNQAESSPPCRGTRSNKPRLVANRSPP